MVTYLECQFLPLCMFPINQMLCWIHSNRPNSMHFAFRNSMLVAFGKWNNINSCRFMKFNSCDIYNVCSYTMYIDVHSVEFNGQFNVWLSYFISNKPISRSNDDWKQINKYFSLLLNHQTLINKSRKWNFRIKLNSK